MVLLPGGSAVGLSQPTLPCDLLATTFAEELCASCLLPLLSWCLVSDTHRWRGPRIQDCCPAIAQVVLKLTDG